MIRSGLLVAAACLALCGQEQDPAWDPLNRAYQALEVKAYEAAVEHFLAAVKAAPERPSVRKDLAYAYLKIGETESARDQFQEVMRLAPDDLGAALEFAFLCHETGKTGLARHVFDRLRKEGDPAARATAETAFQNIDRPLEEGIQRWREALKADPDDFSAHRELADLASRREDLPLAAEHYLKAWRLRPQWRNLLVDLGKAYAAQGLTEQASAALLAASRGAEPRAAEAARRLLPERYPYVYEFRHAIELDPDNLDLRRELVYLLEAMGRSAEAQTELHRIPLSLKQRPDDAIPQPEEDVKKLADRSYQAGYLRDALKYYSAAHERDPLDFRVMLQLGWTHNMMGQDGQALRWFGLARRSADQRVTSEADRAYEALRPSVARFRTTIWLFPTYSSRWRDVFSYGQVKTEWKLGRLPVRAYLSTRFIGDTRTLTGDASPQYLSERSLIFGAGLATSYWHGLMLWAEAGSAAHYQDVRNSLPRMAADYRGGVAFYRGIGTLFGRREGGLFAETNDDGVFLSRFQNDFLLYSQNRTGYTLPPASSLGNLESQLYWNTNFTADLRRQYWANTAEMGPGIRFRWKWMPTAWVFSVNLLRGVYTRAEGNPWPRTYTDLRAGFWYAFTR
ncbi:MAG TPA: tetratricopeptide repeat protein [Bryobacteraceae bacterium]|nr:tetratricopeptide repeat protein [Bryobacteraceae bacterium]